eukprot:m.160506 g.160506  ORF g.160506 m.160506 type:complete len:230 (-) comp20941_c0_seq4:1288-1977(-)
MEQKLCACTAALRHDPASAPLKSFREEYEGERDLSGAGLQRMTKKGFLTTALAVLADASDALSNTEEEKEKQEPDSPLQIPLQIPDLLACVRILSREMGGAEDLLSAAAFGLVLGVCLHPSSSVGVHHEGIKILTNCILQRPDSIACFLQAQGLHKLAAFVQRHTFSQLPEEVQIACAFHRQRYLQLLSFIFFSLFFFKKKNPATCFFFFFVHHLLCLALLSSVGVTDA